MSVTESRDSRQFLEALLTELDRVDKDSTDVLEAHHLDTATGQELDKIGRLGDIQRQKDEDDELYRERIRANLAIGNSNATFEDLIELSSLVLQTDTENITVETYVNDEPVALIQFDGDVVDERTTTDFSAQDIVNVLNRIVSAGHNVTIKSGGTFQLSSDTYIPPDGTGLINDTMREDNIDDSKQAGTIATTIEPN